MSGEQPADEKQTSGGRGGVVEPFDPSEVLALLKSSRGDSQSDKAEPFTTREIADALDRSRSATHEKCKSLFRDGKIRSKKVGARGRVWWLPLYTASREGDTHE